MIEVNTWSFLDRHILRRRSVVLDAAKPRKTTKVQTRSPLINARLPILKNVARRKTGRTMAASAIFPQQLHSDTCSLCFSKRFSTPTLPMTMKELNPERRVAKVAILELRKITFS